MHGRRASGTGPCPSRDGRSLAVQIQSSPVRVGEPLLLLPACWVAALLSPLQAAYQANDEFVPTLAMGPG